MSNTERMTAASWNSCVYAMSAPGHVLKHGNSVKDLLMQLDIHESDLGPQLKI